MIQHRPDVSVIVTCKGRLEFLRESLPRLLTQQQFTMPYEVVLVDYDCPDDSGDWALIEFGDRLPPGVTLTVIMTVDRLPRFNVSHARNIGAVHAMSTRCLSFIDSDSLPERDWLWAASHSILSENATSSGPGWRHKGCGYITLRQHLFWDVRGYDESMTDWGFEDEDFLNRVKNIGGQHQLYDPPHVDVAPHSDEVRTRYYENKKIRQSKQINIRRAAERIGLINPNGFGRADVAIMRRGGPW